MDREAVLRLSQKIVGREGEIYNSLNWVCNHNISVVAIAKL